MSMWDVKRSKSHSTPLTHRVWKQGSGKRYYSAVTKIRMFALACLCTAFAAPSAVSQTQSGTYDNSLVIAPLYVEYLTASDQEFANQVQQLKAQLPAAPYAKVGFAAYIGLQFADVPLDQPLTADVMAGDLNSIDVAVQRALTNGISLHLALISNFFHGASPLRYSAVRQDVRNAQWFADGWIADPSDLQDPSTVPPTVWITPSRYAQPFRQRVEEGVRLVGQQLAHNMSQFPNTLVSVSGDGEVELSFERNYLNDGSQLNPTGNLIYTDYSPFMVEEFRDWIRGSKYAGDLNPNTDDNGDGHTFDGDFGQSFTTWDLRYFNDSGPISFADYVNMPQKLPTSGPYFLSGGFDAPRQLKVGDPFWSAWIQFRQNAIHDWLTDFATWVTTSPDPATGFTISSSHLYTHQIPADFIFGKTNDPRLQTSASPVSTAVINPIGSTGVTAFNGWDGRRTSSTATSTLFAALFMTSDNWSIMEYNPSIPYSNNIPPNPDPQYYSMELRTLWNFRPHVLVPFAWTDDPVLKMYDIKSSLFQQALRDFIKSVGSKPWFSWHALLN